MTRKLGLGPHPNKVEYLFIGETDGERGTTPWYKLEGDKQIPVYHEALTGTLTNIVVTTQDYKNDVNYKVNFHIQADVKYVIRTGAGTVFSRGFVLGLMELIKTDPSFEITVAVSPADESKSVFCNLYNSRGERVKINWDGESSLLPYINTLQGLLGTVVQDDETIRDKNKYWEAKKNLQNK